MGSKKAQKAIRIPLERRQEYLREKLKVIQREGEAVKREMREIDKSLSEQGRMNYRERKRADEKQKQEANERADRVKVVELKPRD